MDQNTSRAIDMARAFAITMVVVLHTRTGMHFDSESTGVIADLISRGLGALGVPLFLFISGFLSSARKKSAEPSMAVRSILKRAGDLLGIYVFWNIFVVIAVFSMIHLGMAPGEFLLARIKDGIAGIFGLNSPFPIAYQFWFIRELIFISVLVGCVGEFIANRRILLVFFFAFALLVRLAFDERTLISLVAYCLGYYLGRERVESAWRPYAPLLLKSILIGGFTASALLLFQCVRTENWAGLSINVFLVTGTFTLLSGALILARRVKTTVWSTAAGASFFIFAAHEPLLTALKKLIGAKLPAESVYVIAPCVVVIILFSIYWLTSTGIKDRLWFVFRGSRPKGRLREHHPDTRLAK